MADHGKRRRGGARTAAAAAAAALAGTVAVVALAPTSQAATGNLVVNPTMEASTRGWYAPSAFVLERARGGHTGTYAVRLRNTGTTARTGTVNDARNTVAATTAGHVYVASAWVRTPAAGRAVSVRLMEYRGRTYLGQALATVTLPDTGWHRVRTTYTARTSGASLDLNVVARVPGGASVLVDDVALRDTGPVPPVPPSTPTDPTDGATPHDPGTGTGAGTGSDEVPAGWTLAWNDEFDGTTLDTTRWGVQNLSTFGDGNNELACLMADNVKVAGGALTISARRATTPVTCGSRDTRFPGGREYTSGMAQSKASWQYGRFEIRARIPTAAGTSKGLWPAFWMRPAGGGTGELDILEAIGGGAGGTEWNKVHQTIHYDYVGTHPKEPRTVTTAFAPSDGFHTYAAEWEPGAIRWYVDGALTYTRTTATTPWLDEAFSKPFFIRLNLAVGGSWPGSPDAATAFPGDFTVDWVRVYHR